MNSFAVQLIFYAAIFLTNCLCSVAEDDKTDQLTVNSRAKRMLYFPYNSCIAFAVVLAIPLSLKGRNVFMSYNFETNYYLSYFDTFQGLVPLPFATIDAPNVNSGTFFDPNRQRNLDAAADIESDESILNSTTQSAVIQSFETTTENKPDEIRQIEIDETTTTKKPSQNNKVNSRETRQILDTLMSRKKFYKILVDKMEKAGFDGEECLFKAICEAAEQPFGDHNGVLGDIVHIIFSPSTSRNEKLSIGYYKAERDGQAGLCHRYETLCPFGILELITQTLIK